MQALTRRGHCVLVQQGAGEGSLLSDEEYVAAGGELAAHAADAWAADMVVKVKEPVLSEYQYLRKDFILFMNQRTSAHRQRRQLNRQLEIKIIAPQTKRPRKALAFGRGTPACGRELRHNLCVECLIACLIQFVHRAGFAKTLRQFGGGLR